MNTDPLKTIHTNVGLLNILFTAGAGGTFLANMLGTSIIDPWNNEYSPTPPSKTFTATNEFTNPCSHIAMVWHPIDLINTSTVNELTNTNWINLIITPEEAKFTKVLHAVKRQNFAGVTKEDILYRLSKESNDEYNRMHKFQSHVVSMLAVNNNVLDVKFSDVFVDGNTDVILSMLNLIFNGHYHSIDVVKNIAKECMTKHDADIVMYNELSLAPEKWIDCLLAKI